MTSFKNIALAFALTLVGAACGSDSNSPSGGNKDDAGTADSGTGIVPNRKCKGLYVGYTNTQLSDNIKDAKGKCANETDIEGVCAKTDETDPSSVAKDVGLGCFFAYNGDGSLTEEQRGEKITQCTLVGTKDNPGLTMQLKSVSKDCLSCYAASVLCATKYCATPCSADPSSADCTKCRDDNKCVSAFYECTGLATSDELKAAK